MYGTVLRVEHYFISMVEWQKNRFQFVPAVFSHTGQIHDIFKKLIREQIRQKLICFEGQAEQS